MATRNIAEGMEGTYFITFTCQYGLPSFETTNSYDTVYNWLDHLRANGHYMTGYVIMPNHLHALIDFGNSQKNINTINPIDYIHSSPKYYLHGRQHYKRAARCKPYV